MRFLPLENHRLSLKNAGFPCVVTISAHILASGVEQAVQQAGEPGEPVWLTLSHTPRLPSRMRPVVLQDLGVSTISHVTPVRCRSVPFGAGHCRYNVRIGAVRCRSLGRSTPVASTHPTRSTPWAYSGRGCAGHGRNTGGCVPYCTVHHE